MCTQFNNEIKKQIKGGLKLTGVVPQIFKIWWDRKFARKLKDIEIEQRMNQRCVDDINIAAKATVPRLSMKKERLSWTPPRLWKTRNEHQTKGLWN